MVERGKVWSFSYLRSIACIAIIALHTVYCALLMYGNSLTQTQYIATWAVNNCLMWAVPVFIMVTGALLLDAGKKLTYSKLFKKYIARVLGALIVFGVLFAVIDMFTGGAECSAMGFFSGCCEVFAGTSWSHLWYLYLLIGLYLLMPFYKKAVELSSDFDMKYLLMVSLIFLSLKPILGVFGISCGFYIHVSTIYPFFLFCGYAVHKRILKISPIAAGLLAVVGTAAIVTLTVLRWSRKVEALDPFFEYSSIFVVMQATGIFALADAAVTGKMKWVRFLMEKLDGCSFGVYLIHMIFVRLLFKHTAFNPYTQGGVFCFLAMVLGFLIVSWTAVWILKKIPGLRAVL